MKRKKSDCLPPNKKAKSDAASEEKIVLDLSGTGWALQIRELQESDICKVEDVFSTIRDWKDYVIWEENPKVVILCDTTGIWRAGAIYYSRVDTAKISLLATSIDYRRQGLGRVVVHFMVDFLKTKFAHIIAAVMDEKKATGFWKSVGFGQTDEVKFQEKLHVNESTLPVYELRKEYPPFSEYEFQAAKRKLNLERFVETEEELERLKLKMEEMDNGELIDTESDDSDFEP